MTGADGRTMSRLRRGGRILLYGNPLYGLTLGGRAPGALAVTPADPWPGNAATGLALLNGVFRFAGQTIQTGGAPLWRPAGVDPGWLAALHGFDWLRDLRAVGGDAARRHARMLVGNWIERHRSWSSVAWTPDVLGARIANWVGQHDFFCASADDAFRGRVFESLSRQARHLGRVLPGDLDGLPLLGAVKGLVYAALALPERERRLAAALGLLERELARQVLPDGVHAGRNPEAHLLALRHLVDLRAALRSARIEVPQAVQHAVDRMSQAARFFRHGDGGLVLFNGGQECEPALIDSVLAQADAKGRPLKSAPHAGFERLAAGRVVVVLDTGTPPPPGLDAAAHAGALAFEMSVGRERLIVNCGAHPARTGPWRQALAATAAHSTLTVADTNSAEVLVGGGLGRRPGRAEARRQEREDGILVEASHDGYARAFALMHRRRLFLSDDEDLRGEDRLEGAARYLFALRFHLAPGVEAALEPHEAGSARLRLPSGTVWRLTVVGGELALDESVYLGRGDAPRPTAQLVVRGRTAPGEDGATVIKWALRRDGN